MSSMELDFGNQAHYLLALLPEIILSVTAMVILLVGVSGPKDNPETGRSATDLGWVALFGVLAAAMANGWLYGVHEVGSTSMVALDRFRLFANWIFLIATGFTILTSLAYVARQRLQVAEFYALILFATVGMMFMGGTRDLLVLFLGLEVMSIAVYALAAFNRRDRRSAEAGLKYFLLGAFSTAFFLYGIALIYGATGSTNIALIGFSVSAGVAQSKLLGFGIALMAVGFGFKVSAVPFHMWTPDVYEGAPTPVTAFMSTAVKAGAFVAFLRVFTTGLGGAYESWFAILWWLAVITMVGANFIALAQGSVKRMLAYSSIAHGGYLLVAVVALNDTAASAMLFYLLVYTVMNVGVFGIITVVSHHGEEHQQVEDYAGFGWRHPALGVFLTIFLLSLAGFPGTAGFMGKVFLLRGAAETGLWSLSIILVLTTLLSYWYYLRVAWYTWMREPTSDTSVQVWAPLSMRVALFTAAAIIIYLGIFPGAALELAESSVEGLSSFGGFLGAGGP